MEKSRMIAPIAELKEQAKRLRGRLNGAGVELSHSAALELLAQQHGLRDWNTLRAMAEKVPHLPMKIGDRVSGRYLGQPFTGEVKALSMLDRGRRRRVTLHFDAPVDVVTFDSFSSYRQRVTAVIDGEGVSPSRRSDGTPHLVLDRPAA